MFGYGGFIAAAVDQPPYRFVHLHRLEQADAALIAAIAAIRAAPRLEHDRVRRKPERGAARSDRLNRLAAIGTEPADEPLGEHRPDRRGDQERLDLHVAKPGDRADGVVGMDGGQDEVPGQGGLDGDVGRLAVANLADHDDIRILAKDRPKAGGEGEPDLGVDLGLADSVDGIFDRILDREDVAAAIVEPLQPSIKARRLAGAGRAGDENDSVRLRQRLAEQAVDRLAHAEPVQVDTGIFLVEDSEHDPLAGSARKSRDSHVDQLAAQGEADPAILRKAALGDVEPGHHLDPADDDRGDVRRHSKGLAKHAVHPHPDDEPGLVRLDMDVADPLAGGVGDDPVDEPDRRRVVRRVEQIVGARQGSGEVPEIVAETE